MFPQNTSTREPESTRALEGERLPDEARAEQPERAPTEPSADADSAAEPATAAMPAPEHSAAEPNTARSDAVADASVGESADAAPNARDAASESAADDAPERVAQDDDEPQAESATVPAAASASPVVESGEPTSITPPSSDAPSSDAPSSDASSSDASSSDASSAAGWKACPTSPADAPSTPPPPSAPSPAEASPTTGLPAEVAPLRSRMRAKSAPGEEPAKPISTQRPGGEPRGGRGGSDTKRPKGGGKPPRGPREERSDRTTKPPASSEDRAGAEQGEPAAESPPPEARTAKVAAPPRVDLPPADVLDAELEAAIAAAQSSAPEQPPVVAAARAQDEEQAGEAATPLTEEDLEPGMKLSGKVQTITGDDVFVELGFRSSGVVSLRQFEPSKKPLPGQLFEVVVDRVDPEEGLIHVSLPKGVRRRIGGWESVAKGQIVECMVARTNKGGLEISVGGLRGFLPASQVDLHYVGDLEPFVGQKLRVQITEANPKKRNLVVSRRAIVIEERKEAEEHLWQTLDVGQEFDGTVKTLKDYGAFVDIGGVDGFVHVGEISWSHIRRPGDVLQVGQQVRVKVLSVDREKNKIGLGIRQLQQNPWDGVESKYPKGDQVRGTVTRTTEFGAFVQLEPGIEGLVHISELDHQRVRKVTDVLKTGQEVDVQVLESDAEKKRISLSVKALLAKPEAASREQDSAAEPYVRKHKEPLKGGTGDPAQSSGGLFGNPRDFQ